jgi:hypothetical protein
LFFLEAAMLSEISEEDLARLDAQRLLIRTEIRARYGESLRIGRQALPQLQRLLDDKVFAPAQKYELQCIGICWGDILCAIAPFRWKQTTISIHALTMLSKRVEDGEDVDAAWLADKCIERAQELETGAQT